MRNEIYQAVVSAIETFFCNGSPGWRHVAFINMTDTSYNCPTGLTLTSFSRRTCAHPHSNGRCFSTFLMLETCHTARCVGGSGDTNMELLALLVRDPGGRVLKATMLVE